MTLELLLFLLFLLILKKFFLKSKSQKFLDEMPGPRSYPIVGSMLEFLLTKEDPAIKMRNMPQKYGSVFLLWFGQDPVVCLTDPDDVEIVLTNRRVVDRADAFKIMRPFAQEGIFTSEGDMWRKQRRMLTPAFTSGILQSFLPDFQVNAQHFIQTLSENMGKNINIVPIAARYAFDVIIDTAMKHENVSEKTKMMKAVDELSAIIGHRPINCIQNSCLFPYMQVGKRHDELIKFCHGVTENMIKERRNKLIIENSTSNKASDGRFKRPFLDLLLELKEEGVGLTDQEIRMQVDTFMVAGYDTTQSAVYFTLYCLSQNPEIQEKAYDEMREIFEDSDREPTYQDLQNMKYLDKVILESLRLYSITRFVGRKTQEDIPLKSGYTIPKNCNIFVFVYAMHIDPKLFPEPHIFDPERFENPKFHPFAYLAFGKGPRDCIGKRFAMLSMKSLVSRVLRSFQLFPCKVPEIVPLYGIVMKSSTGVHLKAVPRKH